MQNNQAARNGAPFFQLTETGDVFEAALRHAVRTNSRSMNELHDSITTCVISLRNDGMECEAVLLTMKAFIRELGLKHLRSGTLGSFNVDWLMDQIVRWCISDYYAQR